MKYCTGLIEWSWYSAADWPQRVISGRIMQAWVLAQHKVLWWCWPMLRSMLQAHSDANRHLQHCGHLHQHPAEGAPSHLVSKWLALWLLPLRPYAKANWWAGVVAFEWMTASLRIQEQGSLWIDPPQLRVGCLLNRSTSFRGWAVYEWIASFRVGAVCE